MDDERLTISVPECARWLGISRGLCYQLAANGRLPGVLRLGKRLVVSKAVLKRALEEGNLEAPVPRESAGLL